jgi:hypothetical protein
MIVYKIQHARTHLFSKGGMRVNPDGHYGWSKNGKIWGTLGKLRAHITSHLPKSGERGTDMSEWRIISYQLSVKDIQGVHEVVTPDKILKVLSS